MTVSKRDAVLKIALGLAHDLQHPIQSIENVCTNLERAARDPALLQTLKTNLERELAKIKHVLGELHHITQDIPYLPIRLPLARAIDDAVQSFRGVAAEKGITISVICDDGVFVHADKFSFNRLLNNLLANAIQAISGKNGRIDIRAGQEGKNVTIGIADNGNGIAHDDLPHIFEEFWTRKSNGFGGLGLGLAIAKRIARQHGGTIAVTSTPGKGAAFTVTLASCLDNTAES